MRQKFPHPWKLGLSISTLVCVLMQVSAAHAEDQAGPLVYVLERVEQTTNGKVPKKNPGLIEVATPFGKKNATIKYYRRFSFEDGKINVVLRDKKNVGAIDNPKMIQFGQESELNIQYRPPPKIVQPGKSILIPVSWSARAQIGCFKNGGVRARFAVMLYEIDERKENIVQENLRASHIKLSRDELVKNCRNKTKTSKKASGSSELFLKLSTRKVPTKSLVVRMEGPGSLGMLYHYSLKPKADVQLADAEPVPAIESDQGDDRACNYDRRIVALEKKANLLARRGLIFRRLMTMELPELPVLDFCLVSGGNKIEVQLKDNDSYAQKLVDFTDNVQNIAGLLGNAADITERGFATVNKFDDLVVETLGQLRSKVVRSFRFIAASGDDFSSTMSTALNLVRDGVLATKASSNPDEIVAFVNETVGIFPTALKARKQMICKVKQGVPDFYLKVAALNKVADRLKQDISENAACASGGGRKTLGDRLRGVVRLKMRELNKREKWLSNGIIKKPGDRTSFYDVRRNWVDRRVTAGNRSAILAETDCR